MTHKYRPRNPWVIAVFAALLLMAVISYGFRTETYRNPELGTFFYKYKFGRPATVSLDSNGDGEVDAIGFLDDGAVDFQAPFKEYYEDRNFDGHFEIRAIFVEGMLNSVEVDKDRDGNAEDIYRGDDASDFFLRMHMKEARGALNQKAFGK